MPTTGACKPNLFIVGALKCGTTAWFEYLRSHPDIFMPELKEPSFFTLDLPQWRRAKSQAEYLQLFANGRGAKVIGEASPMHLVSTLAAQAIRDFNPAAKILILLRAQEHYLPSLHNQFLLQFDEEIEGFEEAWRLSACRPPETVPETCIEPRLLDYAAMGHFHEQVSRYLDAFPAEQIRVIWFHDWVADPRAAYRGILDFLGLEDDGRTDFPPINRGATYRSRRLARFIVRPPGWATRLAKLAKRTSGPLGRLLDRTARKLGLLSAYGYEEISPELSDEIQAFYAEDNRQLQRRLVALGAAVADGPRT